MVLSKKMDKVGIKLLVPGFIFIFLFGFLVSAQSTSDGLVTAPYGQQYDLKRTCSNNGTYCSSSTSCNVTIVKSDGSLMFDNRLMTNNIAYYNITAFQVDNRWLGKGFASMTCKDPSGDIKGNGYSTFEYDITADGNEWKSFPNQLVIMIIGFILIFVGKLKDDFTIIQNLGSMISIVMGVITIYPGYNYLNYSTLSGLGIGAVSLGIGFFFLLERNLSRDKEVKSYDNEDDGRYHDND